MHPSLRETANRITEHLGIRHKEIPTFGVESIKEIDGKYRLHVELATTGFFLPLVHLNFPGVDEAAIGWFDPNPEKNPQIDEAATTMMAEMLKKMRPKVVVMTNSTKSENFIQEAVKKLPKGTRLIILPSGSEAEKRDDVTDRSSGQLIEYTPVTGTKKLMGYPKKVEGQVDYLTLEELQKLCPHGKGLVIADDVYTTGETIRAMEKILGLKEEDKHQVAVIAIEKQYDAQDGKYRDKKIPKNVHAVFNLTEFLGLDYLLDRNKLHIYDKPNIPPAIVENYKQ